MKLNENMEKGFKILRTFEKWISPISMTNNMYTRKIEEVLNNVDAEVAW